jgi:integrase/recombinase XerD
MPAQLFNKHGERLFFNEEERSAFIEAADSAKDTVRTFCNVLHYTGCNFTEALNLTPRHIDCAGGAIVFQDSKVSRAVPIPTLLIDLLDEVHAVRRAQTGLQADERIWPYTRMTLFTKVTPVMPKLESAAGRMPRPRASGTAFSFTRSAAASS